MPIRLPRLPTNWKEQSQLFERYWDEILSSIEKILNEILALPIIQQAVATAQAAAVTAQNAANTAQSAVNTTNLADSLLNSYPSNFTGDLVSANSSGVVTIVNHTRVYGKPSLNPSKSVTGGTVSTGAAVGSKVRIYYSDPLRNGGAVTYLFTVDPATPPIQTGSTHSVGAVVIPAAGTQAGKELPPPGYIQV